jgi:hypothetical protein
MVMADIQMLQKTGLDRRNLNRSGKVARLLEHAADSGDGFSYNGIRKVAHTAHASGVFCLFHLNPVPSGFELCPFIWIKSMWPA